jgi:hypothetical protein
MTGGPPLNPEFTGVQLNSFRSLASQMSSVGSQLDQLAHALWSELNKLGVSTAPAMKIQAIAQWVHKKSPELQQRYQLALQWNNSGGAGVLLGGYVKIDETKIGDAAVKTKDGQAAAPLAKLAAKGDEKALNELLSKYGHEANNPYFATAFMKALGAKNLVELPAAMARHLYPLTKSDPEGILKQTVQDNSVLLKLLNSSLATATNPKNDVHVGQDFTNALKQQGRALHKDGEGAHYYGYWGLGQILHASRSKTPSDDMLKPVPFGTAFLKDVGGDMINWDRQRTKELRDLAINNRADGLPDTAIFASGPFSQDQRVPYILNQPGSYPPGRRITSADPLAGLAEAASTNRKAAQELLDYPPNSGSKSNLSYLLHDRRDFWGVGDHGDALGHMLEAAEGGQDDMSKRLAVWTSIIRSNDIAHSLGVSGKQLIFTDKDELDALSAMRDSEAKILGAHMDAVVSALSDLGPHQRTKSGDVLDLMDHGQTAPHFSTVDLDRLLVDAGLDDQAYQSLIDAASGHMRLTIDQVINSNGDAERLTGKEAAALAHIVQARGQALLADGRLKDKKAQMQHDRLANLVSLGVGFVPIPGAKNIGDNIGGKLGEKVADNYKKIAGIGYGKLTSQLVGEAQSGAEDRALTATDNDESAAYSLMHQMIQSSILDHERYEHKDLAGQPFAPNGKIDPKLASEEHHYAAFRKWLEGHSDVLGLEQQGDVNYGSGHTHFNVNMGLPRDA